MEAIEFATDLAEGEREALAARRVRYEGVSAAECIECGDDIPEGRRLAIPGCCRCTSCEEDHHKRSRP